MAAQPHTPIPTQPTALQQLGETVREQREFLGLYRTEVARRADIHVHTVKRIELGLCDPGYTTLVAIAEALDLEPSDLVKWARPSRG